MASPSTPQHEPTMEEILASIRKIISEDSPEAAPAQAAAPAAKADEGEVLELTQELREEPVPAPAPVVVAAAPPPAPIKPVDDVVFQSIEEAHVSSPATAQTSDGLFSDKTRKAFDDAISGYQPPTSQPRDTTAAVAPVDGRTVEAVFDQAIRDKFEPVLRQWLDANTDAVVARMKPVIQEWLDEHFQPLLEAAVEKELRGSRSRKTG